jgi:hypothetical protein
VVDVQEGFRPVVLDFEQTAANVARLVQGANVLDVPVYASEQYPQGLGSDELDLRQHRQAVVCGIESHICVWQTARGLIDQGIEVHVARDAVSSRTQANRDLGIELIERAGGSPTSVETALFELLGMAGTDEFKQIQKIIK